MADIRHLGIPESEPPEEPQDKDEIIADQRRHIELLEARLRSALALLNDPQRLTSRAIALLNGRRGLGFAFAAGAIAALLLTGGSLGIKAVYDAFHHHPASNAHVPDPQTRIIYLDRYAPSPTPSSSPSPSPAPSVSPPRSGSASVPLPAVSPPLPLPSPSLPVKVKHCPPLPDAPPRCLPLPTPLPSLPPI